MASVFSQIIAGDLPAHRVYETTQLIAIMTIQPVKAGHVLVIPKAEVDHWHELDDELSSALMTAAKKVAKAIEQAFTCQRVGLFIAGFDVPHTHIHLVPMNAMSDLDFNGLEFADNDDLANACEKIKACL